MIRSQMLYLVFSTIQAVIQESKTMSSCHGCLLMGKVPLRP